MSRFLSRPSLGLLIYSDGRAVTRGDVQLLYHQVPFRFEIGPAGSGDVIEVPAFDPTGWSDADLAKVNCRGVTDLTSTCRPFRNALPPNGPYVEAALAHDDGYVSKGWGRYDRAQVDQLLKELMVGLGVPAWKREVIYYGVRFGGGGAWGR